MEMEINRFGLELPFCENDTNTTKLFQIFYVHAVVLKIEEIKEKHFVVCNESTGDGKVYNKQGKIYLKISPDINIKDSVSPRPQPI